MRVAVPGLDVSRFGISVNGETRPLEHRGDASNGLELDKFTAYSLLFTVLLRTTEFPIFCKRLMTKRLRENIRCSWGVRQKNSLINSLMRSGLEGFRRIPSVVIGQASELLSHPCQPAYLIPLRLANGRDRPGVIFNAFW